MPEFTWEQYDLGKEMRDMTLAELIERYKQETETYQDACVRSLDLDKELTEVGKENVIAECEKYDLNRIKIAFKIADTLAGTDSR